MAGLMRQAIEAFRVENASSDVDEGAGRSARLSAFLSAIIAFGFVWLAYDFGLAHRFHQVMPDAIESHNVSLATAITERFHGIQGGYVAHAKVLAALRENGVSFFPQFLEPLGKKHPDVAWEPDTINRAIQKAIEVRDLGEMKLGDRSLVPMTAEDLGLSDFYKLSFSLFGPSLEGFYDTYFVIFAGSVAVFLIGFWRYPIVCAAAALMCAIHYLLMYYIATFGSSLNELTQLATVHNRRFISALGVMPALYLASWFLLRPALTPQGMAGVVAQTALLLFVVTMRASISYIFAFLAFLFVAGFLCRLFASRAGERLAAFRLMLFWPVIVVAGGLLALDGYRAVSVNSLYYELDEYIPRHLVWHSLYYGLAYHPEWQSKFSAIHDNASGDDVPMKGAALYAKEKYGLAPSYLIGPINGGIKWRTYERLLKGAYLGFVAQHPRYVAEQVLWFKPRMFVDMYEQTQRRIFSRLPAWMAVTGAAALIAAFAFAGRATPRYRRELGAVAMALSGSFVFSMVPLVIAYPVYHAMGDQIWWASALLAFLPFGMLSILARWRLRSDVQRTVTR